MLLIRTTVTEEFMIPVGVGIIKIGIPSVALVNHNPRTGRILPLVIDTGPKFLHVRLSVVCIIRTVRSTVEQVIEINGIISPGLKLGGSGRCFPTESAVYANCGHSISLCSVLGGHEYYTE